MPATKDFFNNIGPSRHFAAMQHFRRFRTEADIEPRFYDNWIYEYAPQSANRSVFRSVNLWMQFRMRGCILNRTQTQTAFQMGVISSVLRRNTSIKGLERNIAAARSRRTGLSERLAAAEALLAERKAETARLALEGANDQVLDVAEAAVRTITDRLNTLRQAKNEIDAQIASLEAEAATIAEEEERQASVLAINKLAGEIQTFAPTFVDQLGQLATLMSRAKQIVPEAAAVGDFAGGVRREMEMAFAAMGPLLQSAADHIQSGHRPAVQPSSVAEQGHSG
jgi:hypothetical protein